MLIYHGIVLVVALYLLRLLVLENMEKEISQLGRRLHISYPEF
jgi:hypothetical protein